MLSSFILPVNSELRAKQGKEGEKHVLAFTLAPWASFPFLRNMKADPEAL